MRSRRLVACALVCGSLFACSKPTRYTSNVEILQTEMFGEADKPSPAQIDLDLLFVDCPGAQRKIVRGDRRFATCAKKYKRGDKVPAEILVTWRSDRGSYRSDVVKVGDCERKPDPKDTGSYDQVQQCTDVVVNGVVTGVHCDRTRNDELVTKCPWFRRK